MPTTLTLVSDLHLEFDQSQSWQHLPILQKKLADIVVLAGDIGVGYQAIELIDPLLNLGYQVIYILGNHELFGHEPAQLIEGWEALAQSRPGLTFLHNGSAEIHGVLFFGTPLYSNLGTDSSSDAIPNWLRPALKQIADFRKTPNWQPENMVQAHYECRTALGLFLQTSQHSKKTRVIITHFLPSLACLPNAFVGHPTNPYFAADLDALIKQYQPNLWLHGHTHLSVNTVIGNTQVFCNPKGYKDYDEINPAFSEQLIIHIKEADLLE